jgi:hypothetical protein
MRPSKLNSELINDICKFLSLGNSVIIVCGQVGIDDSTYYKWRARGKKELDRVESDGRAKLRDAEAIYVELFESTTRAIASSAITATAGLRKSISGFTTNNTKRVVFTETRQRKLKDGTYQDYEYRRVTEEYMTIEHPPDWRACVALLARRFPEDWSEQFKLADWRTDFIQAIRDGEIDYKILREEVEPDLAKQLFIDAGFPHLITDGR